MPYTANGGELLLAVDSSAPAGCIAYRAFPGDTDATCCEIKRLFVVPEHRGRNIAKNLVRAALERARLRGYEMACLDTDPETMPAAHRTYLSLGFVPYEPRNPVTGGGVLFLRKPLTS